MNRFLENISSLFNENEKGIGFGNNTKAKKTRKILLFQVLNHDSHVNDKYIDGLIYKDIEFDKLKKPSKSDLSIILIRLFIIYLIIEPSVFQALKGTSNPGYAKSLININTLFVFILGVIFLNAEITFDKIFGMCAILIGAYFIIR